MANEKKPRENRTKKLMLEQTPLQKAELSLEIERVMTSDLDSSINYFVKKFGKTFDTKLGMDEDDILQDVREQIWKGLITWRPSGRANKKTYINNLIRKRFLTLLRRSGIGKFNLISYFPDVYSLPDAQISPEHVETHETGEVLLQRRQELMRDRETLSEFDQVIYTDLLQGFTIEEMASRHRRTRMDVVGAIKSIDIRISDRRINTSRGTVKKDKA